MKRCSHGLPKLPGKDQWPRGHTVSGCRERSAPTQWVPKGQLSWQTTSRGPVVVVLICNGFLSESPAYTTAGKCPVLSRDKALYGSSHVSQGTGTRSDGLQRQCQQLCGRRMTRRSQQRKGATHAGVHWSEKKVEKIF